MPPAILDDYGYLKKSSKSELLHRHTERYQYHNEQVVAVVDGNKILFNIT